MVELPPTNAALERTSSLQSEIEILSPLEAIALSNKSLTRRRWDYAVWQTGEYLKGELAISLIGSLILGGIVWLNGSVTLAAAYWAVIGFLALFVGAAILHWFRAPSEIDKAIRCREIATAKRLEGIQRHSLLLEVVEGPWTHWHSGLMYSHVTVMQDSDYKMYPWTLVDIRVRFRNNDVHRTRLDALSLALRREVPGEPAQETLLHSRLETEQGTNTNIEGIFIDARDRSQDYFFRAEEMLDMEWSQKLDSHSFLRLKMDAVGQRSYCVDLDVDWNTARSNDLPVKTGRATLRKVNSC